MSITGYTIYRYKDKKDPKLIFDIVIYESDNLTINASEINSIHLPTNLKIPFGSSNTGQTSTTTITRNPNANLQIYKSRQGSLGWDYKGNTLEVFTNTDPAYGQDATSSFTVAYPLIFHCDDKYYYNPFNNLVFYSRSISNLTEIYQGNRYLSTYDTIKVNIDKDVDPIYPWFGDDLLTIRFSPTPNSFIIQDYLSMYSF